MSNCCGEPLSTHHCPRELRHVEAAELGEEEIEALEVFEKEMNLGLSSTKVMGRILAALVRRLLSSTPPDPSIAAKNNIVNDYRRLIDLVGETDAEIMRGYLAALDQEKA